MNFFSPLFQANYTGVNGWAILTYLFASFIGGYLGVTFAKWVNKK
jgi:hypothetical protein